MKHWVFDLDGTLINSCGLYDVAIAKVFTHFDRACSTEMLVQAQSHFVPHEFFRLHLPENQIDEAYEKLLEISHKQLDEIHAHPGMLELVRDLHRADVDLSIWTGREKETADPILRNLGFDAFFPRVVTRTCVARTKPSPDGLQKVLAETIHRGGDVVMIGDHAYDIQGARACGVRSVSVSWDHQGGAHPLASVSDLHFYEVSKLHTWALSNCVGSPSLR